jgi:hypothetical protein
MSKVLNEFRNQTSDGKQSQTGHEQLKPRRHLHGAAREVDSRLGSDGRRHREDDKKRKDGADDVRHVGTSIPESLILYTTSGRAVNSIREKKVGQPDVTEVRTWGAHERVSVKRATAEEGKHLGYDGQR